MGLRINYNGAAANAWRNLGINDSRLASSVEKLSSGLRINKAGDDPAGLIISERLKAQITGLGQAVRNAQEAVSLVQTGEGALTEMNNMLNKIRALAVHSANTGVNDADSIAADQAQVDSALDSLQKIAENTKYQQKKLLDGSSANKALLGAPATSLYALGSTDPAIDSVTLAGDTSSLTGDTIDLDITSAGSDPSAIVIDHLDSLPANNWLQVEEYDENLNLINQFVHGWFVGEDIDGKMLDILTPAFWTGGAPINAVKLDADQISFSTTGAAHTLYIRAWDATGQDHDIYAASRNGLQGYLTASIGGAPTQLSVEDTLNYNIDLATPGGSRAPTAGEQAQFDATNDFATMTVIGGEEALVGTVVTMAAGQNIVQSISNAITLTGGTSDPAISSVDVAGSVDGATTGISGNIDLNVTAEATRAYAVSSGFNAGHGAATLSISSSDHDLVEVELDAGASMADVVASVNQYYEQTGIWATAVDAGSMDFTFSAYGSSHDITIATNITGILNAAAGGYALSDQGSDVAGNLSVAYDGAPTTLSMTGSGLDLTVDSGEEALSGTKVTLTGADASDSAARSGLGTAAGNTAGTVADAFSVSAGALEFSLGQDANSNEIRTLSISSMKVTELGAVEGLSSATLNEIRGGGTYSLTNDAANAVAIIDAAIDDVSIARAALGAFQQNALETTIANLSINKENLEVSNSRIRDVDMAQEMMEFTKNQILVEAGTAMLSQANQLPIAVLQLLQV